MIGLEPCRKTPAPALTTFQLLEAHESFHLVAVAAHGFNELAQLRDVAVGTILHQPALGLQPPEQAIEQWKPVLVGMADRGLGGFGKTARHGDLRSVLRHHRNLPLAEQARILPGAQPGDIVGPDALSDERAGRIAPLVEISLSFDLDPAHQNRASCSGRGANMSRRSLRSTSRIGLQPPAVTKGLTFLSDAPRRLRSSSVSLR